jgi:CubicO group peptidase (beta-lactamase class C family)
MECRCVVRTVAVLAVTLGLSAGASALAAQDSLGSRIDQVFADIDVGEPGCAVGVMRGGEPVAMRGYGTANLEYDVPIEPSSVFHVASVSKQFTAMAVALLVAEGKVSWQDDIRRYVPEVPDFGKTITLRHLANHTSGLRDQWDLLAMAGWRFEADVITQGDVLDITARQRAPNFEPGAEYLYSNTGFTLLGVVVERVSGESLRAFTTARIFGPLGMTRTHFHDDHNMVVPGRAYGYARTPEGYRLSIPDFDVVGATSLFTTVEDMARWDRNFITAQVGGRAVIDDLLTRGVLTSGESIDYAAGVMHGRYRGLPTVGHSGADAGYRSDFVRFPDQDTSIAVLCSFPNADPGGRARKVADLILEDQFPQPSSSNGSGAEGVQLSLAQLEAVAGLYMRDDTDVLDQVRVRDGVLVFGGGQGRPLVPVMPDRFRLGSADVRFLAGNTLQGVIDGRVRALRKVAPASPGAASRAEYTGTFWSDDLGAEYRVELSNGRLRMWTRKRGALGMTPRADDRFSAGNLQVSFTRDASGRIDGFTASTGRVRKVRFDRAAPHVGGGTGR